MDKDMSIKNINDFLEDTDVKPLDKAISNSLYGFKHFGTKPILESNTDNQGFTFFTRPQLNLSTINIRNIRSFYSLLDKKRLSANRFVRVTLDPRLPYKLYIRGREDFLYGDEIIDTPLVDKYNAFIPILSNTLKNMSGWPDMVVPTFTSSAGIRKEQISMIDGSYEILDSFDLTATFKNFQNEPLTLLFNTWVKYASLCFEGMMYPYIDTILENEFDYNTRIYRFVMDKSGTIIKKWSATGASFPYTFPSGKFYDFADDKPYSDQTGEININFKCMGAMYNEDILLKEFNQTSAIFNPYVRAFINKEYDKISIIPDEILPLMNYRGYPVIDLDTRKFIWITNKGNKTLTRILNNLKAQAEQRRQEAYAREQARKGLNKELDDSKNKLISGYEKYNKKELAERKARLKVTEPTIPAPVKVEIKEALYEEPVNKSIKKAIKKQPIKKIRDTAEAQTATVVRQTVTNPRNRDITGWTQAEINDLSNVLRNKLNNLNSNLSRANSAYKSYSAKLRALSKIIDNLPDGPVKNAYVKSLNNAKKNLNMQNIYINRLKDEIKKTNDTLKYQQILLLPKNERTDFNNLEAKEKNAQLDTNNKKIADLEKLIASDPSNATVYAKKIDLLNAKNVILSTRLTHLANHPQPIPDTFTPDPNKIKTSTDIFRDVLKAHGNNGGAYDASININTDPDPELTTAQEQTLHEAGALTYKEVDEKIADNKRKLKKYRTEYNKSFTPDDNNPYSIYNTKNKIGNLVKVLAKTSLTDATKSATIHALKSVAKGASHTLATIAKRYGKDSQEYKDAKNAILKEMKGNYFGNATGVSDALLSNISNLLDSTTNHMPGGPSEKTILESQIESPYMLLIPERDRNDQDIVNAYKSDWEKRNKKKQALKDLKKVSDKMLNEVINKAKVNPSYLDKAGTIYKITNLTHEVQKIQDDGGIE